MSTEDNKAVVEEFDAMLNTGDLRRLADICLPDMVNHALAPDRPAGLEGTREFLTTQGKRFRDDRWTELHVVADDDMVVHFGHRSGNYPGGSFLGFDLGAGLYTRELAFIYRLQDGRIAERWAIRDDIGFIRQLGSIQVSAK